MAEGAKGEAKLQGDIWIESPVSLRNPNTLANPPRDSALPGGQNRPSADGVSSDRNKPAQQPGKEAGEPERNPSLPAREVAGSTAFAGGKGPRRLTEAERLLTLWAGDKYVS